jgi:SAM-dependent methyltransferase
MNHICASCGNTKLSPVIDFGVVALAGAFLKPSQFASEKKYPLRVVFCPACFLLQVEEHVPPEEIFDGNYFYFSSKIETLKKHFELSAKELVERFVDKEKSLIVEIGCNDGVLLKPLHKQGCKKLIGVDPSTNILSSMDGSSFILMNRFFSEETANLIVKEHGQADLIIANNVIAHISNIRGAITGVERLLSERGVFAFEVHYLGDLIDELQYDMIYHEHIYYYSLLAVSNILSACHLEIFDVKPIPTHGGSMRYYVKRCSNSLYPISRAVLDLRKNEVEKGFGKLETFSEYSRRVSNTKSELLSLLDRLRDRGPCCMAGYGASGRANTILQYCGLNSEDLRFIVDDAPAKQGFVTPGTHIPIVGRSHLDKEWPQYMIVFAWTFLDEIIAKNMDYLRNGGAFIVPLPDVKIVRFKNEQIERVPWRRALGEGLPGEAR